MFKMDLLYVGSGFTGFALFLFLNAVINKNKEDGGSPDMVDIQYFY